MGLVPAPFLANLFLYTYENEYISGLSSNDQVKCVIFTQLNVLLIILVPYDVGVFNVVYKDIYPKNN